MIYHVHINANLHPTSGEMATATGHAMLCYANKDNTFL